MATSLLQEMRSSRPPKLKLKFCKGSVRVLRLLKHIQHKNYICPCGILISGRIGLGRCGKGDREAAEMARQRKRLSKILLPRTDQEIRPGRKKLPISKRTTCEH